MWCMPSPPPVHLHSCLPMVIDRTPLIALRPCHIQSVPAYWVWPPSRRQQVQGSTNCCELAFYLSLRFEVLNRTSSKIYGSWYLPMVQLGFGSFTLINISFFIDLLRFCASLPTLLNFFTLVWWPVMLHCS